MNEETGLQKCDVQYANVCYYSPIVIEIKGEGGGKGQNFLRELEN